MKFTIERVSFLKLLSTVNVAIGQKSPTPAFLNFKLEINDNGLVVTGSDNDITIQSVLPFMKEDKEIISNYTEGSTLISAKYLIEIIRRLDSQLVTLEIIDDVIVQISDNKSHFQLNAMRSEEYPDLDLSVIGEKVSIKTEDFKKIISQTAFAASTISAFISSSTASNPTPLSSLTALILVLGNRGRVFSLSANN